MFSDLFLARKPRFEHKYWEQKENAKKELIVKRRATGRQLLPMKVKKAHKLKYSPL